jgi:hypothetical protein
LEQSHKQRIRHTHERYSYRYSLTLSPLLPVDLPDEIDAPTITFDFEFRETPNAGPCAGGTALPCGDLVGFAGVPNTNLPFEFDGVQYFASVLLLNEGLDDAAPIDFLSAGECTALGFDGQPCQGFLTAEDQRTTINFGLTVSQVPIQVPVAPTLGLVMAGLGLLGWRKKSSS